MLDRAAPTFRQWSIRPRRLAAPHSPVSTLITRAPVSVEATTTLAEAVDVMNDAAVSALLVEGSGAIVTERDLARALGAGRTPSDPVAAVATPNPTVVAFDTTIQDAADVMLTRHLRHLVVDVRGKPAVVSIRDVLAVMAHHHGGRVPRRADHSSPELWIG